jgi:hypothetical protein
VRAFCARSRRIQLRGIDPTVRARVAHAPYRTYTQAPLRYWRLTWDFLPVGLGGIEPPTSALSVLRSNRLSYSPEPGKLRDYPTVVSPECRRIPARPTRPRCENRRRCRR